MNNYAKHISKIEYERRSSKLEVFLKNVFALDFSDIFHKQKEIIKDLESIYIIELSSNTIDVFRHPYSLIYTVLQQCNNIDSEETEALIDKIQAINSLIHRKQREYKEDQKEYEIYGRLANSLYKLWDHLSLDLYNIQQTEMLLKSNLEPRIKELQELKQKNETIDANIKKIKKKANAWQKDMITILGIFSSIILIVAGDLSFSKNMFESIATTPTKDLIKIFCLSALLFFNSMMIMLHVVDSKGENNTKVLNYGWIATNLILIVLFIINSLL